MRLQLPEIISMIAEAHAAIDSEQTRSVCNQRPGNFSILKFPSSADKKEKLSTNSAALYKS